MEKIVFIFRKNKIYYMPSHKDVVSNFAIMLSQNEKSVYWLWTHLDDTH